MSNESVWKKVWLKYSHMNRKSNSALGIICSCAPKMFSANVRKIWKKKHTWIHCHTQMLPAKFYGESLNILTCAKKKKQVECQMLHLILFYFTDEALQSRFAWKLSSTLVTLAKTSTHKKSEFLNCIYYLFWIYCSCESICTPKPKRPSPYELATWSSVIGKYIMQ